MFFGILQFWCTPIYSANIYLRRRRLCFPDRNSVNTGGQGKTGQSNLALKSVKTSSLLCSRGPIPLKMAQMGPQTSKSTSPCRKLHIVHMTSPPMQVDEHQRPAASATGACPGRHNTMVLIQRELPIAWATLPCCATAIIIRSIRRRFHSPSASSYLCDGDNSENTRDLLLSNSKE